MTQGPRSPPPYPQLSLVLAGCDAGSRGELPRLGRARRDGTGPELEPGRATGGATGSRDNFTLAEGSVKLGPSVVTGSAPDESNVGPRPARTSRSP